MTLTNPINKDENFFKADTNMLAFVTVFFNEKIVNKAETVVRHFNKHYHKGTLRTCPKCSQYYRVLSLFSSK